MKNCKSGKKKKSTPNIMTGLKSAPSRGLKDKKGSMLVVAIIAILAIAFGAMFSVFKVFQAHKLGQTNGVVLNAKG